MDNWKLRAKNISKHILLPLAILFVTELFYREPLWQQTLEEVPVMQEKKKLYKFFHTITTMGNFYSFFLIYALCFNLMPRPAAMYIICASTFVHYLNNEMKSIYNQERPYWVNQDIKSSACLTGLGNPSGHMMGNVFIYVSLYLHRFYEVGVIRPRMSMFCNEYIIRMGLTAVLALYIIFMGFSRVFLGAHSYN